MSDIPRVLIIGAGDHGRGTLEILRACNRVQRQYEVVGFLDDAPWRHGTMIGGVPVLGSTDRLSASDTSLHCVIAIADCRTKHAVAGRLAPLNLRYARVIDPTATLAPNVEIAAGVIISAGVVIAYSTAIGEHVTINLNATVGHDCVLGPLCTVAPGANIAGKVQLGEGCDIGLNATLVKGIQIGAWASVGPGTVVLRNLAPGSKVFGNPARAVS